MVSTLKIVHKDYSVKNNLRLLADRGRTKKKKRDFFGTIKKRLSRSKNRSKSMDPSLRDESLGRDASLNRSVSADRARDSSVGDPNRAAGTIQLRIIES